MRATGQNLKRLLKQRGWGRRPWPEGGAHTACSLFFADCCFLVSLSNHPLGLIAASVAARVSSGSPLRK